MMASLPIDPTSPFVPPSYCREPWGPSRPGTPTRPSPLAADPVSSRSVSRRTGNPRREVSMPIDVSPVRLEEVLPLRELYRQEMNCQIVHDSLPRRGFGNLFLL